MSEGVVAEAIAPGEVAIEARGISKRFPGVQALDDVSFDLRRGEIHALMGENGAGKSTLIKILSGLYRPDGGTLEIEGKPAAIGTPRDARLAGIATVYQEFSLVDSLTVAENIFMGRLPKKGLGLFVDWKKLNRDTEELLEKAGMSLDPKALVGRLSVGFRQQVEIARAFSLNSKVVIFDEPTAVLTTDESSILFRNIARLKERGAGIVYISHRMEEIFEIADRITVLRDGRLIRTLKRGEASHDEVIRLMVGRSIDKYQYKKDACASGEPIIRAQQVTRLPRVRDVSLSICRGEILGLYGLVGAGRTELARVLFGLDAMSAGAVFVRERPVRFRSPRDAVAAGIGFLPEDRHNQGLIIENNVLVNNNLANHGSLSAFGFFKQREDKEQALRGVEMLDIKTSGIFQRVAKLSGGNQQKIILSRWLTRSPKPEALILDEPTRGVDVGAKNEIHRLVRRCAEEGMAVLMISSEMNEILTVSDRIVVMREGRVAGELTHEEASEERIVRLAAG